MASERARHKDKEFEALFKEAERHGWRITRTKKNHFRLLWPVECGDHRLIAPSTPSDHRALRNFKAEMRKCERSVV